MSRPPLLPTQIASTDNEYSEGSPLLPAESLAATVADAVLKRGETPDINVAVMCTLALLRLLGRYDWTADEPGGDS